MLIATAEIVLGSPNGKTLEVRTLLDSAAETSFITEEVANILSLTQNRGAVSVIGISSEVAVTSKETSLLS